MTACRRVVGAGRGRRCPASVELRARRRALPRPPAISRAPASPPRRRCRPFESRAARASCSTRSAPPTISAASRTKPACHASPRRRAPDRPAVQVSWRDADAYAAWLSRSTGLPFRLPTDEEWAYAAGSRFSDDAEPASAQGADPGRRALALYDKDAARNAGRGPGFGPEFSPGLGPDLALDSARRRSRSALLEPMSTGCSTWQAMSGNGPTPALCARPWIAWARSRPTSSIAECAWSRGAIAPTCPTSSAMRGRAAARSARRPAPLAFALFLTPRADAGASPEGPTAAGFRGRDRPPHIHRAQRPRGQCARQVRRQAAASPRFAARRNCISLLHQGCAKMQKR